MLHNIQKYYVVYVINFIFLNILMPTIIKLGQLNFVKPTNKYKI